MKRIFTLLFLLASFFSYGQSTTLVISQAYGAGGNANAVFNADFVELHNVSAAPVDITGYSIQYASATSTTTWSGVFPLPSAIIPAGGYYLIQMSNVGANGAPLTPDATATPAIAMASASGKVALVNNITPLVSCNFAGAGVVDMLGYGSANCSETATTGTLSSANAAHRNDDGCADTDVNSNDFTVAPPNPRNSSSPAVICSGSPVPTITAGTLVDFGNVTVGSASASQTFSVSGTDLTGFPGDITVTAPSADFEVSLDGVTWSSSVTIPYASATLSATDIFVQFVPQSAGPLSGDITINGGGIASPVLVAVSGNGVSAPTPSITAGTLVDFGNVDVGSASAPQTFTVSGSDLTGFPDDITVTAPSADFQVSLDGVTWSSSVTIPFTSATLNSTTIHVQFVPQSAGALSGNISIDGGGIATPVLVAVSGTGVVPGTPAFSATAIPAIGDVCVNVSSTPVSFTITGTDLTNADVVVGPFATPGYTFSTSSTGPFSSTLTINQPGGAFSQEVWVQLTPQSAVSYSGNIPVSGGGVAAALDVAVTANGVNTMATVVTGNAVAITMNSATLEGSITDNGCSPITAYGFEYSTTPGFTTGTVLPSTNLSGNNYSADVSGLTPATTYFYKAFATNDGGTAYGAELSFTTLAPQPATLTATALADFGSVCVNQTAGPNSFTLTGTDLNTDDVVVGPLAGFTFATTAAGPFSAAINITQPGGAFTQDVFVQFTPDNTGSFNGNIPVSGGGTTSNLLVAVTGDGSGTGAQVATTDSMVVDHHTAILSGAITTQGCGPVTEFGVEYSGIQGFTPGFGTQVAGDTMSLANTFAVRVGNLVANTRYYFRAYAISDGVTTYGDERSFTTKALEPGLVIYGNPVRAGGTMHFTVTNLENGHYMARLYNMIGQVVFQHDVILQVGFIDDRVILPANLPTGVYTFEVMSNKYRITRQILVK